MKYSTDQVLNLAPDTSSIKAAQKLAVLSKWLFVEHSDNALWGHCQGSGKKPYEVSIDLSEPAFKCSCPSRKFPCKHSLAIFLIYARGECTKKDAPEWVQEWLKKRQQREESRKSNSKPSQVKDTKSQMKRYEKRVETIRNGLADCELWLKDILANGLVATQNQGYAVWNNAATRLIDAKAPGAAMVVKQMASVSSGRDFNSINEMIALMGYLFALIKTFKQYETLPSKQQADIRSALGWSLEKSGIILDDKNLASEAWIVLGESIRELDKLREQRIWLHAEKSNKKALILNFAYKNNPLDISLIPGMKINAEIAYYPSASPLRALVKNRAGEAEAVLNASGSTSIEKALECYAKAKAENPWIRLYPLFISNITPQMVNDCLSLHDTYGRSIVVSDKFKYVWELLALSGGKAVTVIGEWERKFILPLGCWSDEGFYQFKTELMV